MRETYKVFVKTNDLGQITAINSSAFLKDFADWVEIDSGVGDKYALAQGNYLPAPVIDDYGRYNFKLVDGLLTAIANEEKPAIPEPTPSQREQLEEAKKAIADIKKTVDIMRAIFEKLGYMSKEG